MSEINIASGYLFENKSNVKAKPSSRNKRNKKYNATRSYGRITPSGDIELVTELEQIKKDLNNVHNSLDWATDPVLIDSYAYEIKALHLKYQYYLQLYKEKGAAL